jgi:hypothetical protein
MEPKMDQLMGLKEPLNVNKLFRIQLPEVLPDSVLVHLFQSMMIYEIAFLEGCSLVESSHSCILMWQQSWAHIPTMADARTQLMVNYAKNMHASMDNINKAVLAADIYEGGRYLTLILC